MVNGYGDKEINTELDSLIIFTDGGVKNNHDKDLVSIGASSYVLYANNKVIQYGSTYIGQYFTSPSGDDIKINSILAEYHGLLEAIKIVIKSGMKSKRVIFVTDCRPLVQHITNKKPKNPIYMNFYNEILKLLGKIDNAELKHVTRDKNKLADSLVNELLNRKERSLSYAAKKRS